MPQVRLQILNDREDRGTRPHGRKEKRVEGDVQRIQDPSKPCSCLFEETCIIGADEQHRIATEITDMVNNNFKREISSTAIGEHIMERLRKLDKVAYVRFASVYKDFTDPKLFAEEVDKISSKDESAE